MSEGGGLLRAERDPLSLAPERVPSDQRRVAFIAIGSFVAVFALYWPTTLSLFDRWQDTVHRTYTHGYFIVALSVWLVWRARAAYAEAPLRPFLPGAVVL